MTADKAKISELHMSGFNCAQVVAYMCCDLSGADEKTVLAGMGGFGGGLRCGEVCGAAAGAIYSLGLCCPYNDCNKTETKGKIAELAVQFTTSFREEFGALPCRDLLADGSHERCETYMARAVELLNELIERDKENGNL